MKLSKFLGLNNVQPTERLKPGELVEALNVDIDGDGAIARRAGYVSDSATEHRNVFEASTFTLATKGAAGDLVNAGTGAVLHAALGHSPRVWYLELPDGKVIYSNGVANGVVTAAARTAYGVPIPVGIGAAAQLAGTLPAGDYRWAITHVRLSDGREGAPLYSAPVTLTDGGITLTGLPTLADHRSNLYLTTANGEKFYFAGTTVGSMFAFTGPNELLQGLMLVDQLSPPRVGTHMAFWRGRVLLAVGNTLRASQHQRLDLFDEEKDVRQFPSNITMVQPVEGGIWVGTETELAWLEGVQFDQLAYSRALTGRVVPGSGVRVDGDQVRRGQGMGSRTAALCIADGNLVACFADGAAVRITDGRYETDATEVWATFRKQGDTPQYMAVVRA